jgi:hypothetical protein
MMTFRGTDVMGTIGDEAGVHSFRDNQGNDNDYDTILIETTDEPPIQYEVPSWLAKADYQADGYPRRRYNIPDKFVHEIGPSQDNLPRFMDSKDAIRKLDREGRWLADLIQWRREARVWSHLEDDWPKDVGGLDVPF